MAVVYIDGVFYDKKEDAKISVWDHGLLYGDGLFEGIRVYNGKIFRFDEHMKRLYDSAKTLAIDIPHSYEELKQLTIDTVRRNGKPDTYIRLVVTRGPGDLGLDPRKCKHSTVIIIVDDIALFPPEPYEVGMKVIIASTRKNHMAALNSNVKSLNYLNNILAKIEAVHAGVPEAVMINIHGYITEGTADNVFVVKDGIIKTPPPHVGILVGITRNAVIDVAAEMGNPVQEALMTSHDLYVSDEIFLTGTGAELIPVVNVDGRTIANGKPGPVYRQLLENFRKKTKVEGTVVFTQEELDAMQGAAV
ncbi:MAG: branched-chain-amino-acid transaminase [Firmicutes bacterium]|nr:branched-chain-amino-acid transaminase [Bacillota bacterium]